MSLDNLTNNTVNLTSCKNEIIIQFYFVQKEPGEMSESMNLALEVSYMTISQWYPAIVLPCF